MKHSIAGLIITLALAIFVAPHAAAAQPQKKVHRIGRLSAGSPLPGQSSLEAFRQGLRDLAYVEGQNIVIEQRWAEGNDERLRDLAAELVRLQVEVIVAGGSAATRAAQHATSTIPIVMVASSDPVAYGFVASYARPGGNITGMSWLGTELGGKQLELLKEALPQISRVAVLAHTASTSHPRMQNLTEAARALGVQLQVVELRSADELDHAFAAMIREGAEALFVLAEPLLLDPLRGRIVDLAATSRLPAMYPWKMYVDAGGLMSYGPSPLDMHRRAAYYVDRILKGAKPATLPVETPWKYEFVLNLKAAEALGLTLPPHILALANEVIR